MDYFKWKELLKEYSISELPDELLEDCFLVDFAEESMWFSGSAVKRLHCQAGKGKISIDEFSEMITEHSSVIFREDIRRLIEGKGKTVDSYLTFRVDGEPQPGLVSLFRLPGRPFILGLIHLNYEMIHEYKERLDALFNQLEEAQRVNQLVLEGSTDYIYQLDLVNDTCTFSPKAMDVLDLDSPTFGNAMEKVLSFIVPEDRKIFLKSFTPFLTGESDFHTAEYRVNTRAGDIMWVSCHGKGVHSPDGKPLMIAGSLMDITEQKRIEQQMREMIYRDMLTGLKNRQCYVEEITEYLEREDEKGCIVCIDIHNFKRFNEIFGHSFGNKILKEFAEMLKIYIPDNLGIYRLEGDEFLVHMGESRRSQILDMLFPLQVALSRPRILEGHSIYVDISVAIAIYPENGTTADELLQNADSLLYQISRYDREKVLFFSDGNDKTLSRRYRLEHELRKDISSGFRHFRVVYQPIVKLQAEVNRWYAAEALLRYSNPEIPDVGQQELIETLELTDLIVPVGRWVLEEAVREFTRWKKAGVPHYVHVNFSAKQLSDAGLLQYIRDTLKRYQMDPKYLICELTESALINDFEGAMILCREMMSMGIGIALDDFGTGYSSFNYLRIFPVSQIKIDKTYGLELAESDFNRVVISSMFELTKSMNLELCVEGVETKETLDILRDMNVNLIQGFYFERPMEAEVICREFTRSAGPVK